MKRWFAIASISFFFNDTATTEIYTLSLHDALPISSSGVPNVAIRAICASAHARYGRSSRAARSSWRNAFSAWIARSSTMTTSAVRRWCRPPSGARRPDRVFQLPRCEAWYDSSPPQPKSAVADFGHFVEWPNPRYSEVRLGGGRPAPAGREGVTALQHVRRRCHALRRRHPTPDCLRQSHPPPAGEGGPDVVTPLKQIHGTAPFRSEQSDDLAVRADVD